MGRGNVPLALQFARKVVAGSTPVTEIAGHYDSMGQRWVHPTPSIGMATTNYITITDSRMNDSKNDDPNS